MWVCGAQAVAANKQDAEAEAASKAAVAALLALKSELAAAEAECVARCAHARWLSCP